MLYRTIKTDTWRDPWFHELSAQSKCLFLYLFTNPVISACGSMEITAAQVGFDIGLSAKKVEADLIAFGQRVLWLPEHHLIIVRNFYKHQRSQSSGSFTTAAKKAMAHLPEQAQCWLASVYPELSDTIHPGCDLPIPTLDTPSIDTPSPHPLPTVGGKEEGEVKGRREKRDVNPPAPLRGGNRSSRLPDDFALTSEMKAWAATETPAIDIEFHHKQFCRHWWSASGQSATKINWVLTWQKWMAKEQHDRPTGVNGRASPPTRSGSINLTNEGIERYTREQMYEQNRDREIVVDPAGRLVDRGDYPGEDRDLSRDVG